jgi:small conductance mechanosensitive channel
MMLWKIATVLLIMFVLNVLCFSAFAQTPTPTTPVPQAATDVTAPPAKIDVSPVARDDEIASRLLKILEATEWFERPSVQVRDGVVFLKGTALNDEYKTWASNLVRNTQDAVAVVNKMEIQQSSIWNFKPMFQGLKEMWRSSLEQFPFIVLSAIVLLITLVLAKVSFRYSNKLFGKKVAVPLLRDLIARAIAVVVFILGIYTVMRVSGTTQLALTILGGTGLFGLVLGIAFRDITENFLASIFLSMQRPFQVGDLIEIVDILGRVERLTVRTTVLVTLDGNYVQIPNATVYKNTIRNFTNNPKRRDELMIEIPHDKSIEQAQTVALETLTKHPAILQQPAPLVLVNRITTNTVELKLLYWLDCLRNNLLTTRSAILRIVANDFAEKRLLLGTAVASNSGNDHRPKRPNRLFWTRAEGFANSETETDCLEKQTSDARAVETGPNLLNGKN